MDMRGCVWVGESFLSHDKWQIKLLSEFFPNSHSTFYEWLQTDNIHIHKEYEYGLASGCIAPSYIWMCARHLVMLVALQVAWQAFCTWAAERPKQSRPWKLLRLYWSESAADVKYCGSEFHLCLFYQAYLDLCDQLVVQEILPVLLLKLAIANPFKTKQESQGALEILDEPPCYILQHS